MLITCPQCTYTRNIPEWKIPVTCTQATCPRCNHSFPFRDHSPEPKAEKAAVEEHATSKPRTTGKKTPLQNNPDEPFPFEDIRSHGIMGAFLLSLVNILFRPATSFASMSVSPGVGKALFFFAAIVSLQYLSSFFWHMTGVTDFIAQGSSLQVSDYLPVQGTMLLAASPFFILLSLIFFAFFTHLCLIVVNSSKAGFDGTFKVFAYGSAPLIFGFVPLAGLVLGSVWWFANLIIGFKYIHGSSYPRVILALLVPFLVTFFLVATGLVIVYILFL